VISIVDYGMGNSGSILNMYKHLEIPAQVVSTPEEIAKAEKLILPGVGAFDTAMRTLKEKGLLDALNKKAKSKTPILGICLGAQLLTKKSEEGTLPGLGWIDAETKKFSFKQPLNVPHMGWNYIHETRKNKLFAGIDAEPRFYFVHSYHLVCNEPCDIATTNYGYDFVSAVQKGNIYGVQFHPEKSHKFGMHVLKNFAELA
jgi:imidazole glycerol-phosphate synthase subunit HisH